MLNNTESKCSINHRRKCNNNVYLINMCLNHIKLLYHNDICKIQAYYKGNRCRKYLNMYKKLPEDIQRIIIRHLKQDYYYFKYIITLNKIIFRYVENIHKYIYLPTSVINVQDITKAFQLYNKYFDVIEINSLKHFYVISQHIYYYIDEYMYGTFVEAINLIYKYPILSKINIATLNDDNVKILTSQLVKFNLKYCSRFYL